MNAECNFKNARQNSFSGVLRRQKFIVTKIRHSNGEIDVIRKRNSEYQWSLFNPFIRFFLGIRGRQLRRQLKKESLLSNKH